MRQLEGVRILLADDEDAVRRTFVMMLTLAGALVTETENGALALAAFQAGQFDCLVSDYNMPVMKGDALALAVKTARAEVRVVMISGFAESVRVNGRLPWFIDVLLTKPCSMQELLDAIKPPA